MPIKRRQTSNYQSSSYRSARPTGGVAGFGAFEPEAAPSEPAASTAHAWSDQQQAIFDWFRKGRGHLAVRARAGTGKTTTILEAITFAPESPILLCAFNKSIAVELQDRLCNPSATAATLHSVGYRCIRRFWDNVNVDDGRAMALSTEVCGDTTPDPMLRLVSKLHTKGREILPHADKPSDLAELAHTFDCLPDDEWTRKGFTAEWLYQRALACMVRAAEVKPALGIDFADMIYLPIRNRWLRPQYGMVVVDECQDMSMSQLEIAQGVLARGGRMAVVGDDRQAVYGFRGADSNSLDRLKKELRAAELGLKTTYRCGHAIVAEAQRWVSDIRAHETNAAGSVVVKSLDDLLEQVAQDEFVLSRVNAPLVRVALSLIRRGKRTRIQGRDIGAGLRNLVRKLTQGNSTMSMGEWERRLGEWERKEATKAEEAGFAGRVDYVHDQAETLRALADGAETTYEVESRIETLFSDNGYGFIVCSSVHRAKGLEADRVWALRDTFLLPVACECGHRHPGGKQDCPRCKCRTYRPVPAYQKEEENLAYVATTRARKELCWVEGR